MSLRETYRFLSGWPMGFLPGWPMGPPGWPMGPPGTAVGLVAGAIGVYLLLGSPSRTASTVTNTGATQENMGRSDEARAARTPIATTAGSRISGTVRIVASLTQHAAPGTTLFIYATDANSPGPPLAVLRLRVERWPMSFVLDDADAMIPGRNLSAAQSVQLEARVSLSGEALPRPGDLVGTVAKVDPQTTHSVNISIDHQIS
jgi:cytochrome c-type biogenesis protein CcmH